MASVETAQDAQTYWQNNQRIVAWVKALNHTIGFDAVFENVNGDLCCEDPKMAKQIAQTIQHPVSVQKREVC